MTVIARFSYSPESYTPGALVPTPLLDLADQLNTQLSATPPPVQGVPGVDVTKTFLNLVKQAYDTLYPAQAVQATTPAADNVATDSAETRAYQTWTISLHEGDAVDSVATGLFGEDGQPIWAPVNGIALATWESDSTEAAEHLFLSVYEPVEEFPGTASCVFCFTNPKSTPNRPTDFEYPAEAIALHFAHTRSNVLKVELLGREPSDMIALPGTCNRTRFFAFAGHVCPCEDVCFRVTYIGDPPVITPTWLVSDLQQPSAGKPPRGLLGEVCDRRGIPPVFETRRARDLAAAMPEYDEVVQLRELRIQSSAPGLARQQRFFLDLDATTQPMHKSQDNPTTEADRIKLGSLGARLAKGYGQRAERTARRESFDYRELDRDLVGSVAAIVKTLLQRHFGDPLDLEAVGDAFTRFAGGELGFRSEQILQGHGAPNGVNYFGFAELALAVIETEAGEDDAWRPLFEVFARTAEIFVNAYHRIGGQRRSCTYGIPFNADGSRAYSASQKAALDAEWGGGANSDFVTVRRRYDRLVCSALADDLATAPPSDVRLPLVDNLPQP